ncbi:MAG: hypothetical protein AB8B99_11580 [Phormidesmis sp.]
MVFVPSRLSIALLPFTLSALVLPAQAQTQPEENPFDSVWAGASIQFNATDTDVPIAVDAAYPVTDSIQLRASIGDALVIVAPTVSTQTGQWRFSAGPALKYSQKETTTTFVAPSTDSGAGVQQTVVTTDENFDIAGLVVVERAFGDYGMLFGTVSFSGDVSGSIGAGLRF